MLSWWPFIKSKIEKRASGSGFHCRDHVGSRILHLWSARDC